MPKPRFPKDMQMRKKDACQYLGIGATTFENYVKAGKITHVAVSDADPRIKFYTVADLDKLRPNLGRYAGKRGKATEQVLTPLLAPPPEEPELPHDETPISEVNTLEARLMEAAGVPSSVSLHKGQQLLRQYLLAKAIHHKVVDKMFELLDHIDPRVAQRAARDILDKVLPSLKTVESIQIADPEAQQESRLLRAEMEKLREKITATRNQPVIDAQFRHIDVSEST